ncbi:hypothetical protein D3C78_1044180 [compost metagenome]
MAARADDLDRHRIGAGHERATVETQLPRRIARHVVHGKHRIAGEALEQPVFEHCSCATQALFGRLENQLHGAIEVPGVGQVPGRCQQGGGMAIVAAGMHHTVDPAGIGQAGGFLNRQCIHVGAQPNGTPYAIAQRCHHAGPAHAGADVIAPLAQALRHQRTGGELLEPKLGMGVYASTQADHFLSLRSDSRQNMTRIHGATPR